MIFKVRVGAGVPAHWPLLKRRLEAITPNPHAETHLWRFAGRAQAAQHPFLLQVTSYDRRGFLHGALSNLRTGMCLAGPERTHALRGSVALGLRRSVRAAALTLVPAAHVVLPALGLAAGRRQAAACPLPRHPVTRLHSCKGLALAGWSRDFLEGAARHVLLLRVCADLMHTLWEADVTVFKAHITTGPGGKVLDMFWIYDNRCELPENHRWGSARPPCTRSALPVPPCMPMPVLRSGCHAASPPAIGAVLSVP